MSPDFGYAKEEGAPTSFEGVTSALYQTVQEEGSVEVAHAYLKEFLDDENDRISPSLGMSNRQFTMAMTGQYLPTKEQVWRAWLAANEMKAEFNEVKRTWTLSFIKQRRRYGSALAEDEGSAEGSGDDSGGASPSSNNPL